MKMQTHNHRSLTCYSHSILDVIIVICERYDKPLVDTFVDTFVDAFVDTFAARVEYYMFKYISLT